MTTYSIFQVIIGVLLILLVCLMIKNIYCLVTKKDLKALKRRKKQLQSFERQRVSSKDLESSGVLKLLKPVETLWLKKHPLSDSQYSLLEKQLKIANWKSFNPISFTALKVSLKVIGLIFALLMFSQSIPLTILFLVVFWFAPSFLLKSSIQDRTFALMSGFPDFIRITQGFLTSQLTLIQSIEKTRPFVNKTWKPILEKFLINSEIISQEDCLNWLRNEIPIFEIQELWSLILLNLEQGIDIQECFQNQTRKIYLMQNAAMIEKIAKRESSLILVQGPLLLTMLLAIGLPTISAMFNIGM